MMANHDSLPSEIIVKAKIGRLHLLPNEDTTVNVAWPMDILTNHTPQAPVNTSTNLGAILVAAYPNDVIFDKVYVLPEEIEAGFITEEKEYSLLIWNAKLSSIALITDIQEINIDGITLEHPVVPIMLTPTSDQYHKLTILKDGPAVQNTTIQYTIDSDAFVVLITGNRIEAFVFEPHWGSVNMRYKFHTVISVTKHFAEQRRPLLSKPLREQKADFRANKIRQQSFVNSVRNLSIKTMAVPIFSEPILPSEDLQGKTVINSNSELDILWNINNSEYILIIDIPENELSEPPKISEIKKIASVGLNSITLENPVIKNFHAENSVIYPVFIGVIKSKGGFRLATQNYVETSLEFKEVVI